MESVIIETLGCPLDFNLPQSWKQDSSDYSDSADEETEIKNEDDLIAQIKNLSFVNAVPSKCIALKCSNETYDINSQEKDTTDCSESDNDGTEIKPEDDLIEQMKNLSFANATDYTYSNKTSEINCQVIENSGQSISLEKKQIEEILSYPSTLINKEALKFVEEVDVESTFCKGKNKNREIYSKKDNTENPRIEDNVEEVENRFSSLSLKKSKTLNKYYKDGSNNSDEDESESDNDEQAESVILRERGHTKHNRKQNNRQQRQTPFTQTASTSSRHFNSNCLHTFENFSPVSYGLNASQYGYDSINPINNNNVVSNGIVSSSSSSFYTDFSTSESKTGQVFRNRVSSVATDEVIDCGFAVPERVVPSAEYNGNLNDKFFEASNDASSFYHSQGRRLPGYAVANAEKETLDPYLENLSVEEVGNLISNFNTLPLISNEDLENVFNDSSTLNQNTCGESNVEKFSYSNNTQHNFHSKPNHGHSSFSEANDGYSTSDTISGHQNPVDLLPRLSNEDLENVFSNFSTSNQKSCLESTAKKISILNNNQHNFPSKPDHGYFSFSETDDRDLTSNDIYGQNLVDLYPSSPLSSEYQESYFNDFSALNQNISAESSVEKISYPNNNQHDFESKPAHRLSYSSNIGDSTSDDIYGQSSGDLYPPPPLSSEYQEKFSTSDDQSCVDSTVEKISYPNNNQLNFYSKPDHRNSQFSKANGEEFGYYSNSVCENISSINCESSSPKTTDYERFSKEMEDEIKRIQNKDYKSSSPKRKNNNQTCKTEEPKIYTVYGTAARDMLFNSPSFCKRKWKLEKEEIRNLITNGELGTKEKMVIHIIKKNRKTKYRGTNLHYAIRDENIERVFCLVEYHKECHGCLNTEINLVDNSDKTVLDYSKEKGFDLLTAYLKENTAKSYSDICI